MQNEMHKEKLLLSAQETADTLGISSRHLWTLTHSKRIPCVRLGDRVLYSLAALRTWIAKQEEAAPAA